MKKLLKLFDNNILRFGVAFAILFTALYPKLPSIHVPHTWVYIRLEDFLILSLTIIWLFQLIRKKVSLPKPEGYSLIIYWLAGLVSLLYCFTFIAPHLTNFFPQIAALQYFRRIEYMILFFIAFSTVKNKKDVYFYITALCITVLGIILYGFGQKFYFVLWQAFPEFFQKHPFCFPAFLTGNEEFAKGIPLCLNEASRITSTFGGHYDLAAYMVMIIPLLIALVFVVKRWYLRVGIGLLAILSLELLNFTSSRTSFGAYVLGVVGMLLLWKKKRWIVPVLGLSFLIMVLSGNSTLQRFAQTIQSVQIVSSNAELPSDLKKIISDAKTAEEGKTPALPPPSDFTVGAAPASSPAGSFTTVLTDNQLQKLQNSEIPISSVSGSFLIKKAYALDISFTTRFQAEWPRNWRAFLASPLFGTGYSSLTLATDNDYLRGLGETGAVGLLAFLFIFVILGIFMKNAVSEVKDNITNGLLFGLAGGVIGLLINAVLIDVFEASKVAEPMWILLGIGLGAAKLHIKNPINYKTQLSRFFTSNIMIAVYLLLLVLSLVGSISNFFVADDFIWLKWAATSQPGDIIKYFIDAKDFFYRPLDKTIVYFLYQVFSFQQEGYHVFLLLLHYICAFGVFLLGLRLTGKRIIAFFAAAVFILNPAHSENIFWFSTISIELSSLFIIYAMLLFLSFREKKSVLFYVGSILLSALALVSYEQAIVIPLIFLTIDIFITKPKMSLKTVYTYIPYIGLVIGYFIIRILSQAFVSGGDYSYNLAKIIPNSIGNFIGYVGLFIGGLPFLNIYDLMRSELRSNWIAVGISGTVILVLLGWIVVSYKKQIIDFQKHQLVRILSFVVVFAFVTLLPFLALGNIAPRYLYLGSVGLSLGLIIVFYTFVSRFIKSRRFQHIVLVIITAGLLSIYGIQNNLEQNKWADAGKITKNTLAFFRTGYASFNPNTKIFIINTPVKKDTVWVFPVGLEEGLWFIYRASTPQLYQTNSLEKAKIEKANNRLDSFIFQFTNGSIAEIK